MKSKTNKHGLRAVIMAGGRGTRLKPYTITLPKPLVPVGERPILDLVIRQLKAAGVDHITMAVNHMADLIMAYFGDGRRWGLNIDYSLEETPLGTVGPLTLIEDLPEDFLMLNGDVLTDLPIERLVARHLAKKSELTVATFRRIQKIDFGVIELDRREAIVGFREKPEIPYHVSMGIYMVSRSLVRTLAVGRPFGVDQLILKCLKEKRQMHSLVHRGFWLDIGRPDDYEEANERIEALERKLAVR